MISFHWLARRESERIGAAKANPRSASSAEGLVILPLSVWRKLGNVLRAGKVATSLLNAQMCDFDRDTLYCQRLSTLQQQHHIWL
mmetsp:Transcript_44818/g.136864  ORF Transcript_44818/g.136864 Transcript_44818/m.136864 type:complete len:85 (+) Transcript_44818:1112-1366(+)